ncbi:MULTISPECIES: LrgB family protein [unclassified Pseudoalteromonas]|uniref:LrgB family protein n=1 Tax=unclassified Pseudoalteromonas TaxID=194690 RepID=UPI000B3C6955|nr:MULTISPECIES: LrgB family protein [unclassified Pseudoalteromonas]MDN3376864.1 LrgB family protein [Pseudoalteromonas sp. APC 3893]MDN3387426.1 LrgB family protein [Pseudoalteromonas sp. APC 4017]OUS72501.1 hypothetical protein B5G52_07135 [Pseudoalteromonas sp. A601]
MINYWWLSSFMVVGLFIILKRLNSLSGNSIIKSLTNPVFLAITIVAALLLLFKLPYKPFYQHTQILSWLLEPAIVALAVPLYQQFVHVRKNALLILLSCTAGIINATFVGTVLALFFAAPKALAASVAALSVTTPITLLVTDSLGGVPSLAAAMVIFIGVLGALFGVLFLRFIGISNHQAQGVAIGTACHAIGTAAVLNENVSAGAYASVAMALSALLTALIVPWLYPFLYQALL